MRGKQLPLTGLRASRTIAYDWEIAGTQLRRDEAAGQPGKRARRRTDHVRVKAIEDKP